MHPINHTFQLDEPIKDRWIVSVFSFDQPMIRSFYIYCSNCSQFYGRVQHRVVRRTMTTQAKARAAQPRIVVAMLPGRCGNRMQ